ncbi:MAG: DNA recombination protein RmuC [Christensenellales bacterium]|jgi:DNA recombination protein RmuC
MSDTLAIALAVALAAALLTALIVALVLSASRRRALDGQLDRISRSLDLSSRVVSDLTESFESRQDRLRGAMDERMDAMRDSNDRKLDQLREIVTGKLDARLGESFRTVNDQLARVDKGLGEMRGLASDVGDLKKVLTNARARGAWGEVQLRALIEDALAPGQYLENAAVEPGSSERVEFAILLPDAAGETTMIAVDSKFPTEDYLRIDDSAAAGAAFEKRVLEEGKRISTKYIRPPHTVDYAVMFLPAESLYAEVSRRRGLVERLQHDFRVLIAGPGTFAALLASLRMGFRGAALEKKGAEVMALLRGVKSEFGKYADTIERAKQRAQLLEKELDAVEVRARAVERKLRDIAEE